MKHRSELERLIADLELENSELLSLREKQNAELAKVHERLKALEQLYEQLSTKLRVS